MDTGGTLSIVGRTLLMQAKIRKSKTAAIRVWYGRTIPSLRGIHVTVCLGDEKVAQHCNVLDTTAFDIVIGTDFLRCNTEVKLLSFCQSLQSAYALHCECGSGLFTVPVDPLRRKESGLSYCTGLIQPKTIS